MTLYAKNTDLSQRVLDCRGMLNEWKTSAIVPNFTGKGDVMSRGCYRRIKLLEHATKTVEKVIHKRIRTLINLNKIQFGFILIVKRMQEEYQQNDKKLYTCFVDIEKAFDRVPRKVMDWAKRKKGLSKVMVRAVMCLYDGAKTRERVGSAYSEEFEIKVDVYQGSVLSPLLVAIAVGVITENPRRDMVYELP